MVATLTAIVWSVGALATGQFLLVLLAPVLAYAIAIPSHFIFQGNRPTMLGHPLWSAIADMQMCGLLITGRMGAEVERVSVSRDVDALDGHRVAHSARLPDVL